MSDIKSLLKKDFTKLNPENLSNYKRKWAKTIGRMLKHSEILSIYQDLRKKNKIPQNKKLEQKLTIRKVRTHSGVAPFAVMTKPYTCPGQCVYCPLEQGMPKSYLSDEPAAQRAKKAQFDPVKQIKRRLRQFKETGHEVDKIELIVIGGTFSNYPEEYKRMFFKKIYETINGEKSKTLKDAQKINESAKKRIVGISIETRPDWIDQKEIKLLRELGVTKIQMGVQALDDEILRVTKRGHNVEAVVKATRMLKNAGFKLCYHFMPNLPGSSPKRDLEMAKMMYQDPRFKPDFVKIYPTQVIPKTELYHMWKRGEYKTYSYKTMKDVLKKIKLLTPPWVRIDRLVRDISKKWVKAGTKKTNMRQIIQQELKKESKNCKCIRCREIKGKRYDDKPRYLKRKIDTLGGIEYMLSFEQGNDLYSMLRVRFPEKNENLIFSELQNSAIIREIHTFGKVVPLNQKNTKKTQHQGLGQKLLQKSEQLAKTEGYSKIAVISAIGTRNYYRKFGYKKEGLYMTKAL